MVPFGKSNNQCVWLHHSTDNGRTDCNHTRIQVGSSNGPLVGADSARVSPSHSQKRKRSFAAVSAGTVPSFRASKPKQIAKQTSAASQPPRSRNTAGNVVSAQAFAERPTMYKVVLNVSRAAAFPRHMASRSERTASRKDIQVMHSPAQARV